MTILVQHRELAGVSRSTHSRSVVDVQVELTRQLHAGRGAAPALLGLLAWVPASGD